MDYILFHMYSWYVMRPTSPAPHLYTHLPPRLFVFVVADTPSFGEQRAGEGRRLPTLGILNQNEVAVGPGLAHRAVAIDNRTMRAFSRRLVWSGAFWKGAEMWQGEIEERTVMMRDGGSVWILRAQ